MAGMFVRNADIRKTADWMLVFFGLPDVTGAAEREGSPPPAASSAQPPTSPRHQKFSFNPIDTQAVSAI